ncbi:PAS domain S-box-containing protein [Clostridium algifaecis]|uniref:Stage 0 sporulation protein A homolog n=1 Tax=Clostridium algifaecis TaxID=1472040 RepID=A0ABS4KPQ4_9CLOT|nr:ATP-binding protein [Clostridium algifaecis]MBP2032022.1 PAS domain S-box-containing protein [Clostridium algifaecis]
MDSVLITDDSYYNTETLISILKPNGYKVRSSLSYEAGLKSALENPPDIILLKTNICNMDGYKACEILKDYENLREIPIIFIISENETIDKNKVFTSKAVDYITMPFNCKEVLARIKTHLQLRFMSLKMEKLMKMNNDMQKQVEERNKQLEEITQELREFNVVLDKEITERTKTEEALRESEKKFRYSVQEAPVPIMLYADDGEVIKVNSAWADITGYTIKDIPTTSEWAKVSDIFKENLQNVEFSTFSLDEKQNNGEYSVKTKNEGIRIWNFYSACIGRLDDGRNMLVKVAMDITEKKRIDELKKRIEEEKVKLNEIKEYDRIRTDFFANISHELRTPINVIFSAIQVHNIKLKDCIWKDASIDKYKYTNIMKQNCYRLLRLVNNLIDITKIDSGYFSINETNNNIVSLIEDITLSVADYIENKGLSVVFDTDVEEKIIACDPGKIERIILNLLSNAIKFTPCGGNIMVNVEDGVENICIKVKDTGKGIPKEKLNFIFERFMQVDKSLTREHEGSGIGLSLVKALVELHGGDISVKSKEGYGTEFIVHIPCKLVDSETSNDKSCDNTIDENRIEKIKLEFSDIYN